MNIEDITLVLGIDRVHLNELRITWPTWIRFKPEIKRMPLVVFYDPVEVTPLEADFLSIHHNVRFVPWIWVGARNQREKMITGWLHIPALEVNTPWYLKLDTDVVAINAAPWIFPSWFEPSPRGDLPVFISSPWSYSKPRYVIDLLDDWGDGIPGLKHLARLNLQYSSEKSRVRHKRIISWLFFCRTDWTREAVRFLGPSGRLPHASQDTFLFYLAARQKRHFVRVGMRKYGWNHGRMRKINRIIKNMAPAMIEKAGMPISRTQIPIELPSAPDNYNEGVIYYNMGTSCVVRLLVSLYSLRQYYPGSVTILSEGDASHPICKLIGEAMHVEVKEWDCGIESGENTALLAKTRYHEGTPYTATVALDSDTLIKGDITPLFEFARVGGFCVSQFSHWKSNGSLISKRIRRWLEWLPNDIDQAIKFGPAINCGVVSFLKDTPLYQDWTRLALLGRTSRIPDEVCCQVIIHRYPHMILDGKWNRSCKYDNPKKKDTRIIHFHGRKHCRQGKPYNAQLWINVFEEVCRKNIAGIQSWLPAGDRMLRKHLQHLMGS